MPILQAGQSGTRLLVEKEKRRKMLEERYGALMKKDPSILARNISEFKKELAHLSDKPIIVALGNDVFKWLKPLYNEYKVFKMSHYSRFINLDKYRKEAIAIIKSCK